MKGGAVLVYTYEPLMKYAVLYFAYAEIFSPHILTCTHRISCRSYTFSIGRLFWGGGHPYIGSTTVLPDMYTE